MALSSYTISAEYTYLDATLRTNWLVLEELEADMRAFVPKSMEDFSEDRAAEIQRLQVLNPDQSEDTVAKFVDQQVEYWANPGFQFMQRFDQRYMALYVTVVLVSHALSEAVINGILGLGLANVGAADLFRLLDRASFQRKWMLGPKAFDSAYTFPEGSALHETLVSLTRERNSLTHQKIELTVRGERILEGTLLTRRRYPDGLLWIRRYFSLPYDLTTFASRTMREHLPMLLFDRSPIEIASEHRSVVAPGDQGRSA